ncbi:hypothetical protein HYG86_02610 [Alkalicella caledoniensis]|uniref:Uncharacterized protein n=1 Tax=Alkalicella caledoniensis TaxID=2731377 RepID=A0A7G9W4W4_ALKCA|nr:hypothetical protein [Alkalicella caledoniensis]QNO13726.1 hypothetical protein HYG86_02610 [Alkalicella caledoniensis]
MIKKIALTLFIIIVFFSNNTLAGDIPEAIMSGENQALFIGTITSINTDKFQITPSTVIMGSIESPTVNIEKFDNYYGNNLSPAIGDIIVAVLIDENKIDSLWVFKATSADYETLELISEPYSMVVRYQEYINSGEYFRAQEKIDTETTTEVIAQTNTDDEQDNSNNRIYLYTLMAVLSVFVLVRLFLNKRNH